MVSRISSLIVRIIDAKVRYLLHKSKLFRPFLAAQGRRGRKDICGKCKEKVPEILSRFWRKIALGKSRIRLEKGKGRVYPD